MSCDPETLARKPRAKMQTIEFILRCFRFTVFGEAEYMLSPEERTVTKRLKKEHGEEDWKHSKITKYIT